MRGDDILPVAVNKIKRKLKNSLNDDDILPVGEPGDDEVCLMVLDPGLAKIRLFLCSFLTQPSGGYGVLLGFFYSFF